MEDEKVFFDLVKMGVYKVYKNGKIYRCKVKVRFKNEYKDCKPRLMNGIVRGYIRIGFRYNKKLMQISAHRAVWIYFNGEIPEELETNHKNTIKDDNRLSNLELVTSLENMQHAQKNGLINHGESNSNVKLTEKKVLKIRRLLKQGLLQYKIAEKFDVNRGAISKINTKRSWAWL